MKLKVLKSFMWGGEVLPVGSEIEVDDQRHIDHFVKHGMAGLKKGKGANQSAQPNETKPAGGPEETA